MKKPIVKQPSASKLMKEVWDGVCTATDGCKVELDGKCPHGHVSWIAYLGVY